MSAAVETRQRVIAAAAVLLVASLAAAAVVSRSSAGDETTRSGAGRGDAAAPAGPNGEPAPPAGSDGGQDDGGPADRDGGGDASTARDGAPGALAPAPAGRWPYRAVTRGASGETDRELQYLISETGRSATTVEQRHTVESDGGQANDVSWRPDGQYLVATTFGSGDSASTCTWQPAILLMPTTVEAGQEWTTDSSCTMQLATATTGTARRQAKTQVVDSRTVDVGGTRVAAWSLRTASTITIDIDSPAQDVQSVTEETVDEQVAPSLGMSVRSVGRGTTTTNGKKQETFRELTLLAARPR